MTPEAANRLIEEMRGWGFPDFVQNIILGPQGMVNQPFHDELDLELSQQFDPTTPAYRMVQRFFAVLTYPRDHGKTSHASIYLPLWKIAKDHNIRILSISRTATIAESFLSEVVTNIERNERYQVFAKAVDPMGTGVIPRMKMGRKQTDDWSGNSITIERENVNLKDPTIAATGLFGQILSRRTDLVLCDDVVDQQNSMTELQRQKVKDWIETTVIPTIVPGGTFVYLGNTWHMDDAVSKFMQDPRFIMQKRQGAILSEAVRQDLWQAWGGIMMNITKPPKERFEEAEAYYNANRQAMDEGWQTLWPERYPYSRLYLERLINPYVFARMYQCDPSNRPDQVIKDEWIERALKKGAHLRFQDYKHDKNFLELSCAGMDLAISQKESADDTAVVYLDLVKQGYDGINDGDFIIRQIHRGHYTPGEQRNAAKVATNEHGMSTIRVESVGYQEALVMDLAADTVPVRSYHTGREKFDPEIGINSLALLLENGQLAIPSDPTDPRTIMLASQLANEMRAWSADPTEHTGDALMALWFAYSEARTLLGSKILVPGMGAQIPNSPNTKDPVVLAEGNKKADEAIRVEQEYERSHFNDMMRQRLLDASRRR